MSAKYTILKTIRANTPESAAKLPETDMEHMQYSNKNEKFSQMLQSVGGKAVWLEGKSIDSFVEENYPQVKQICSSIVELRCTTLTLDSVNDPHELEAVDLAIIKGEFAVAENGAVWVQNPDDTYRSLYFLAQQLLIVVPKDAIVDTMHEAYEKVKFEDNTYGVFISGPSKTADIEQSLVIGAHGPTDACVIFE